MFRRVLTVCVALSAAWAGSVTVAHAGPPPPCQFTLTPPTVEGTSVTASVLTTVCAAGAAPYLSVACLQAFGGVNQCTQARGADGARVSVPFQPGTAYTATGRGCANWVFLPPSPGCQTLGPETATL